MSRTLDRLRALDRDIRVVIVGTGAMGRGLFHQCRRTPGITCVAIADVEIERARACAAMTGGAHSDAATAADLEAAAGRGAVAVSRDGLLLAECAHADVLIEASNSIGPAARCSVAAVASGKHLVLMNSEIDLIFGPYLAELARRNGVVFTSCDGDQHGVLKHLIDDLTLWGFDLVMAGNMKGFLDRYANPTTIVPEADKRNLGYKMCTAYTDGTKLGIEMALLANALGLATPVPGMHGPRAAHVREVFDLFDLESLWRRHGPFVDYVLGAQPDGGVFAVGRCDDRYQQDMMAYYKMGRGPFYLFYRPYHLCHVEAMECVADAVLDGRPLLEPAAGFRANVFAYAKRDLRPDERLDGIGGYTCYGMIDACAAEERHPGLPICLAEDVLLTRGVRKDEAILLDDVVLDPAGFEVELFHKALAASRRVAGP